MYERHVHLSCVFVVVFGTQIDLTSELLSILQVHRTRNARFSITNEEYIW